MNSTKSIVSIFVVVLFCLVEIQDAIVCFDCMSIEGRADPGCLNAEESYSKVCSMPFCSVTTVYREGDDFSDKNTFSVTRNCSHRNVLISKRCNAVAGYMACTELCSTNYCNYGLSLNETRPSVSGARKTTTTTSPVTNPIRCYECTSIKGSSRLCVNMRVSYSAITLQKSCHSPCSVTTAYREGDDFSDENTFSVIRECSNRNVLIPKRCFTVDGLTICTEQCSTNYCNYGLSLNETRPSVSGARKNTTTTLPATTRIVRQRCNVCTSYNGNNSACDNMESDFSVPIYMCPFEAPYCSTRLVMIKVLPGIVISSKLERFCTKQTKNIIKWGLCDEPTPEFYLSMCLNEFPCVGSNICNDINVHQILTGEL